MTKEKLKEANELFEQLEKAEKRLKDLCLAGSLSGATCYIGSERVAYEHIHEVKVFILNLHKKDLEELQKQFDKL